MEAVKPYVKPSRERKISEEFDQFAHLGQGDDEDLLNDDDMLKEEFPDVPLRLSQFQLGSSDLLEEEKEEGNYAQGLLDRLVVLPDPANVTQKVGGGGKIFEMGQVEDDVDPFEALKESSDEED